MAIQDLKVWAETLLQTSPDNITQRMDLSDDEFRDGLLRRVTFDDPQVNQLMYLLSLAAAPALGAPFLHYDGAPLPSNAIVAAGQSINPQDNFILHCAYGDTLPDLTGEGPTGFTYIFRDNNNLNPYPIISDPVLLVTTSDTTQGLMGFRSSGAFLPMDITTTEAKDGITNVDNQGIYAINSTTDEASKWVLSGANSLVKDSFTTLGNTEPTQIFANNQRAGINVVFDNGGAYRLDPYDDSFAPDGFHINLVYETAVVEPSGKWLVNYDPAGSEYTIYDNRFFPAMAEGTYALTGMSGVNACAMSRQGDKIVIVADSGNMYTASIAFSGNNPIFDEVTYPISGTAMRRDCVQFNSDGSKIAVMTRSDNTLRVYDVENNYALELTIPVASFPDRDFSIAWSDYTPYYLTVASRVQPSQYIANVYDIRSNPPTSITGDLTLNGITDVTSVLLTDAQNLV